MITLEWLGLCASVAASAMVPFSEIFVAVPLGIVMGLDPVATVVSATIGNFSVALILHLAYDVLRRSERFQRWETRNQAGRLATRMRTSGYRVLLLFTPLIGIYLATLIPRSLGMARLRTLPVKIVSIAVYCSGLALAIWLAWDSLYTSATGSMALLP